jgi:hypothetical protein
MRFSLAAKGRLLVAAALWAAVAVSGQEFTRTQISDTLFNADGSRATGSMRVSWKSFTGADGSTVAKNSIDLDIVDGIVSVALAPNLGAVPDGTYYSVEYRLHKGEKSSELWIVPDSADPVRIADIRVLSVPAAGISVSLAQVNGLSTALDAKADKAAANTFLAPQMLREDAPGTSNPLLGLQKNDGAAGVFFRLPELSGDITYTLPPNAGSPNQSLTTDGSGALFWSSAAGGGGGSGDAVTVNASAVDTTANLNDTTTIAWALVDGGEGGPDDVQASVVANSIGPEQIDETATYDFSGGGMTLPSGVAIGSGSMPFNLTGYTDDAAPSAPGVTNQFTMYVDRSSGLLSWLINGASAQAALTVGAQNAGTDVTADLEEETHASEHLENAADEILVENLGTACAPGEAPVSDGSGGLDCAEVGGGSGGSSEYSVVIEVFGALTNTATGDGAAWFSAPDSLDGYNLTGVKAKVYQAGTTGTLNVDLARCDLVATGNACSGTVDDMLSTNLTIDSGEGRSATAAAAAVIDASFDDIDVDDVIRIDVDAVHSTPAKGLQLILTFEVP